jgi:hypothetical protein
MKHVTQPARSNMCGQCCVAMLLDIPMEDAIVKVGKRGLTRSTDLARALGVNKRLVRKNSLPETCIVKVSWYEDAGRKSVGHWAIKHGNMIYDPAQQAPISLDGYELLLGARIVYGKITSYMEVT